MIATRVSTAATAIATAIATTTATAITMKRNLKIINSHVKSGQTFSGVAKGPSIIHRKCDLVRKLEYSQEFYDIDVFDVNIEPEQKLKGSILNNTQYGDMTLILGGDHLTEYYSISAQLERYGQKNLGVIWVDAHTDINTKLTSLSGCEHGMVVAGLLGLEPNLHGVGITSMSNLLLPSNIVYVGARDIDVDEYDIISKLGIKIYTSNDIHETGAKNVMNKALYDDLSHTDFIHISFDVDVIDPSVFSCTGTPVSGGLSYGQAIDIADSIKSDSRLVSMGLVEFNPDLSTHDNDKTWCGSIITDIITFSLTNNPYRLLKFTPPRPNDT